MDSKYISVPLRVVLTITSLPIFRWVDLFHQKILNNDDTIFTFLDKACDILGLVAPERSDIKNLDFVFKIRDPHKLLTAKLKYNF